MSKRRTFLRNAGLALLPVFAPRLASANAQCTKLPPTDNAETGIGSLLSPPASRSVNFVSDNAHVSPKEYARMLSEIDASKPIKPDVYGDGGVVAELEKKFEILTGKEKAMYMPSGTMANQLAIAALSGKSTKIFVQETSHVYRDEADAAQSVHSKRLVPLAKGAAMFTLDDLKESISYHQSGEVFPSGYGAVSIENPVRRANGVQVPINDLRKISEWCRENKIKLHLDGARLLLASAYSGVALKTYASLFDTVYISLYKYLGAAGGAILCGDADVITSLKHQVKIFGGTMYQCWPNAAMALHYLDGFEQRFAMAVERANQLIKAVNVPGSLEIKSIENGSNIYDVLYGRHISTKKLSEKLKTKYDITLSGHLSNGKGRFAINESIMNRPLSELVEAFKDSFDFAKS